MKSLTTLLIVLVCACSINAQTNADDYNGLHGPGNFNTGICITPALRAEISLIEKENIARLKKEGKLVLNKNAQQIALGWPVERSADYTEIDFYTISNYVDNSAGPGIIDHSCNGRTYDGHLGTDIGVWPFPWTIVDSSYVEVVAAADGTITYKHEIEPDHNCVNSNLPWNAVYLMHADGSTTRYGHLKLNSLTSKIVGQTVLRGEYLGVLASSGNSSGPHLHFEVEDASGTIIDPYSGPCNSGNPQPTWWIMEKPYEDPGVTALMTHSQFVDPISYCPDVEDNPMKKDCFLPGETIYLAAYFRDFLTGMVANGRILQEDGTVFGQWTWNGPPFYSPSYYFTRNYTLPANPPTGCWTFELTFSDKIYTHNFSVENDCSNPTCNRVLPIQLTYFRGKQTGRTNILEWQTLYEFSNDFFILEKSRDQKNFVQFARVEGQGTSNAINNYNFVDEAPYFGTTYYRLRQVDLMGDYTFSKIVALKNDLGQEFQVVPTLVNEEVIIKYQTSERPEKVVIFDALGRVIVQKENFLHPTEVSLSLSGISKGILFVTIYKQNGTVETHRIFKK